MENLSLKAIEELEERRVTKRRRKGAKKKDGAISEVNASKERRNPLLVALVSGALCHIPGPGGGVFASSLLHLCPFFGALGDSVKPPMDRLVRDHEQSHRRGSVEISNAGIFLQQDDKHADTQSLRKWAF